MMDYYEVVSKRQPRERIRLHRISENKKSSRPTRLAGYWNQWKPLSMMAKAKPLQPRSVRGTG